VHEAERLPVSVVALVRVVQRVGGVGDDRQGHVERQSRPLIGGDDLRHAASVNVLEREKVLTAFAPQLEHVGDVGVVQARGEPSFRQEHLDERRVVRQVRPHALERDDFLVARDAALPREVQLGHASARNLSRHLVAPEPGPG